MCLRCVGDLSVGVGVWGAFGLARGNLLLPTWKLPTPKLLFWRYLGTSCLRYTVLMRRPFWGQIFAVALPLGGMQAASSTSPVLNRNQQG